MTDTYRIRSAETWDTARAAYVAGETAEDVCARLDIGLRAFRARAAEEGWRRVDLQDPVPLDAPDAPSDEDLDAIGDDEMLSVSRRRMALAVRRGQVGEALRWGRLHDMVARQSQAEARNSRERAREAAAADRAATRHDADLMKKLTANARAIEHQARAILAVDRVDTNARDPQTLHDLHDLHPVSPTGAGDVVASPPPNRAERRRLAREGPKRR